MIPHKVKDIVKLINGRIVKGTDEQIIEDVAFRWEKLKKINSLLFLRMKRGISWETIQKFAPCTIVTDQLFKEINSLQNCTVIQVDNTGSAYWKFVDYYRGLFSIPITAVTGTCGKTTTKEMIKHILSGKRKVQAMQGSANSRLQDLPYLLEIDETTEAAVIETAVGKPGDLLQHCRYFKPTIGVITNIGVYHLDECKTLEAYIEAKAEMLEGLGNNGTLLLNADDENSKKIRLDDYKGRIIYFSLRQKADFQARNVQYAENGMDFELMFQNQTYSLFVPGYGEHQVYNAIAAIAASYEMGASIEEAAERLKTFKPFSRYLEFSYGFNGSAVLDDTYLTNPSSIQASLQVLNGLAKGRKRIVILGEIPHLGEFDEEYHRQVGQMVAKYGTDILMTVGPRAADMGAEALAEGLKGLVYTFDSLQETEEMVRRQLNERTIVLVKGFSYDYSWRSFAKKLKKSS